MIKIYNALVSSFLIAILALLNLVITTPIHAFEFSSKPWQWKLTKASLYESEIVILSEEKTIAKYELSCHLSDHQDEEESVSSIDIITIKNHSAPLLIVTCPIGAHSARLSIFDPYIDSEKALFTQTGSYSAYWEIIKDRLWIIYDRRCIESDSNTCEIPFELVRTPWDEIQ